MNLKTISILGAGWLGLPLAKSLIENDYQIKIATRSEVRFQSIKQLIKTSYQIDIDTLSADTDAFFDADCLIINITNKNLNRFSQLIEKVEQSSIKYVIFISSTSVYFNNNAQVSEETRFENPDSPLLQIEKLFQSSTRFQTTIIRFAGLIGPKRHPARFFRNGKTVPQANAPVNLIHLNDCLGIIKKVIEANAWDDVFNACTDNHPSKQQFYRYACEQYGTDAPEFDTTSPLSYKIVNNQKVKEILGYEFQYADLFDVPLTPDHA